MLSIVWVLFLLFFFILSFQRKIQVWYHQCNSQYFVDAHCCWFVVSVCFVRCSSTCFIFHVLHLFLCVSELFLSFICRQVARLPNWFPFGFLFSLFNYFNEFLHDFSIDCDLSVSVLNVTCVGLFFFFAQRFFFLFLSLFISFAVSKQQNKHKNRNRNENDFAHFALISRIATGLIICKTISSPQLVLGIDYSLRVCLHVLSFASFPTGKTDCNVFYICVAEMDKGASIFATF